MVALFYIGAAKADFVPALGRYSDTVDYYLAQFPMANAAATISYADSGRMEQSGVYPDFCGIAFDVEQTNGETISVEILLDIIFSQRCKPDS